ncbi:MAG: DUF418 domain-containing protein [Muribaculaceae bacterium]|nr:DUF418 domain-containing protein [Muribaculaceae bacterium]
MTIERAEGAPVEVKKRHLILDALRGFALLGICLANYPEFSLYSFLESAPKEMFPSAGIDYITQYFLYIFVDGKFYTIFSLLFGIGFSIILENNRRRGANGTLIFYRRMFFLLLIGFAHLILIWSGDILMLYAAVGMILPLFVRCRDKTILIWAAFFLLLPVIIDYVCQFTGVYLSSKLVEWQWLLCDRFGITQENFAYWLRDAQNYGDMSKFLLMGAVERMQEFVDGNRYFKVLGLFLIGFVIGRHRLFIDLDSYKYYLKRIAISGLCLGLPLSAIYAWSAMDGKPLGFGTHSLFYFISVYLTSFGYISLFCLLYIRNREGIAWKIFSFPGRMALTNYIGQSVIGVLIFYGVGLGYGADTGLIIAEVVALSVFLFEVAFSNGWLRLFRFGPLEWIWRCLTYLRFFPILKEKEEN